MIKLFLYFIPIEFLRIALKLYFFGMGVITNRILNSEENALRTDDVRRSVDPRLVFIAICIIKENEFLIAVCTLCLDPANTGIDPECWNIYGVFYGSKHIIYIIFTV